MCVQSNQQIYDLAFNIYEVQSMDFVCGGATRKAARPHCPGKDIRFVVCVLVLSLVSICSFRSVSLNLSVLASVDLSECCVDDVANMECSNQ